MKNTIKRRRFRLIICACYAWEVALNTGYHSITYRTGKQYGREPGKLTALKLIQQTMKLPVEFSTGVTIVLHIP
jgi:predicted hydrocarbon binding protein